MGVSGACGTPQLALEGCCTTRVRSRKRWQACFGPAPLPPMSPLNRSHVLREVLTRLGECPTPDGIAAAAKLFADRIADRRQPEMALAALFRHNAPESLGNLTRSTLRDETLA